MAEAIREVTTRAGQEVKALRAEIALARRGGRLGSWAFGTFNYGLGRAVEGKSAAELEERANRSLVGNV